MKPRIKKGNVWQKIAPAFSAFIPSMEISNARFSLPLVSASIKKEMKRFDELTKREQSVHINGKA